MPTQPLVERNDGSVLLRLAIGDSMVLVVLSTEVELEGCRAFLKGSSTAHLDGVRMGQFGPFEVLLARGTDDWSVRILVSTEAGHRGDQHISVNLGRAEVLKALGTSAAARSVQVEPAPETAPRRSPARMPDTGSLPERRVLRTAADIGALLRHLATRWTIPRMVCSIDALAELEQQRAQLRLVRLAESRAYQVGGVVAAGVALLAGAAVIVSRPFNMKAGGLPWTVQQTLEHVATMLVAAGSAWLLGMLLGALWSRCRLLTALLVLWLRVRSLEQSRGVLR